MTTLTILETLCVQRKMACVNILAVFGLTQS